MALHGYLARASSWHGGDSTKCHVLRVYLSMGTHRHFSRDPSNARALTGQETPEQLSLYFIVKYC
jgi:hypothetical protein